MRARTFLSAALIAFACGSAIAEDKSPADVEADLIDACIQSSDVCQAACFRTQTGFSSHLSQSACEARCTAIFNRCVGSIVAMERPGSRPGAGGTGGMEQNNEPGQSEGNIVIFQR